MSNILDMHTKQHARYWDQSEENVYYKCSGPRDKAHHVGTALSIDLTMEDNPHYQKFLDELKLKE